MRAYELTEATIIKIEDPGSHRRDYIIYKNPRPNEVESLLDRLSELRGSVDASDNVYVWEAFKATHSDAQFEIGDFSWYFDFVLSTFDTLDGNDWEDLVKVGDYFYGTTGNVKDIKNKLWNNILTYLQGT